VPVVDLGEVVLKFGVAELVDSARLVQYLAVVGILERPHELHSASSVVARTNSVRLTCIDGVVLALQSRVPIGWDEGAHGSCLTILS
jgi:hypothetical protein